MRIHFDLVHASDLLKNSAWKRFLQDKKSELNAHKTSRARVCMDISQDDQE